MRHRSSGYSEFATKLLLVCTIFIIASCAIFVVKESFSESEQEQSIFKNNNATSQEIAQINQLYQYVTYGRDLQPMYYFIKNREVTTDTIDEKEKFMYAFQLVDSTNMINKTDQSFTVDGAIYRGFIKTIFGQEPEMKSISEFDLFIDDSDIFSQSIVNVSYDEENDQFVIKKVNGFVTNTNNTYWFCSKLDQYDIDDTNGIITISEKFIFADKIFDRDNNVEAIRVYKDIKREYFITEIINPNKTQIKEFGINNYLSKANTITYTFKKGDDNQYHFYSSIVEE